MIAEYGPLRGAVRSLVFSADDNLLVSCQTDLEKKETVWLWDLKTGQVIDRVPTPLSGTEFFGCALSPNDHTIVIPVIGKLYLISVVGTNINLNVMPTDTDQVRLFSSPHEY
jgi:WD40 repeat protein